MIKYEYQALVLDPDDDPQEDLSKLGTEGWQLVSTITFKETVLVRDWEEKTFIRYLLMRPSSIDTTSSDL